MQGRPSAAAPEIRAVDGSLVNMQLQPGALEDERSMEIIKVSANSRSTAVAGAIAGVIREHQSAEVQAIGASAVNQAVKAVAIARSYLALDGLEIVCVPSFTEVDIGGNERTAVRLSVETR